MPSWEEEFICYELTMGDYRLAELLSIFQDYGTLTGDQIRELEKKFFTLFYKYKEIH